MDALAELAWAAGSALLYAAPVILIASRLPRKDHFPARAAGCFLLLMLYVLAQPNKSLVTTSLSIQEFLANALFYSGILGINFVVMLLIHETDAPAAAYCAVVGYTLENLGSALSTLACILTNNPDAALRTFSDLFVTRAFWCVVVYASFVATTQIRSRGQTLSVNPSKMAFAMALGVVLFNIVFDIIVKQLYYLRIPLGYSIVLRLVVIGTCFFSLALEHEMLVRRKIESERVALESLLQAREAQYELSRETIDAVNIKMHDIRHQIRHLEDGSEGTTVLDRDVLRDIAREVRVYDTRVKTGNDALDTILTEKALLGEREGITMSCIADGAALDFMAPADLYSFFGNALENAFEAVRQVNDAERRNISVLVKRVAGMASIHVENYFAGKVTFDGELPKTSKPDAANHGYGVRSMQMICERYGGALTASAEGQVFSLDALIPIP